MKSDLEKQTRLEELAEALNNFYMKIPGGWLIDIQTKNKRLDSFVDEKNKITYRKMFEDVRNALSESGLSQEMCKKLEGYSPLELKIVMQNKETLVPVMYRAYCKLIQKGYDPAILIS